MWPGSYVQPSPIHEACGDVVDVLPSTVWDEYSKEIFGAGPAGAGGTVTGYDQLKAPDAFPAAHLPSPASGVALNEPPLPAPESTAPTTALSPPAATGWTYAACITPEGAATRGAAAGVTVPSAAVSTVAVIVLPPESLAVSRSW